uniref:Immunoglobulin C1-set domain-containing protein n=1 Tax=Apteryx owenii TaxID=8824 RepID=A0A8B9PSX0_APTOW
MARSKQPRDRLNGARLAASAFTAAWKARRARAAGSLVPVGVPGVRAGGALAGWNWAVELRAEDGRHQACPWGRTWHSWCAHGALGRAMGQRDVIWGPELGHRAEAWDVGPRAGTWGRGLGHGAQNWAMGQRFESGSWSWAMGQRIRTWAPEVTVFSEDPVELGDPNMLICYWLKNGQEVVDGVVETVFYLCQDHTFRKFSYLPFIPTRGDYYDCRVEHWGLPKALLKHWEPQVPLPVSESTETLVCALGLAMGIVGIIVGTILIIKAMKMNSARKVQGPL